MTSGARNTVETRIVDDPAEVTAAWMTEVMRAAGSDVEVTGLRYEPVGTGQTARSFRFHLEAAPDQAGRCPASVVVKIAGGADDIRRRLRSAYRNEVGFYTTFAGRALVRVPRCWSAARSADGLRFTLVLEDAHPARAGSQLDGCTFDQAALAVRNLAGLHAPFWNAEDLTEDAGWLVRLDDAGMEFLGSVVVAAAARFTERYQAELGPGDADILRRAAGLVAGWGRHTSSRHSLLHGDYRLDNLLFSGHSDLGDSDVGDSDVQAVDWQTLEVGFPGRDLAYFLSTALAPADRRSHEAALVAAYHRCLVEHGVTGYPVDLCFEDYRRGMLQGPLITMIGCVYASTPRTDSSDRMFLSMAANACAAIRELGVLDLLAT
ncbi:aminoglycoside phosphotransferase [Parafrankia colletiae]|uniref:Aminoglycoside phosphotransferase n=1 Tax=Parafrankia colletiae TaxID=573497 RepID=A0A1S1QMW4_9ACTN|nr:oxidoreductase family protein [Parafrankia colletiae]MCK9902078.1 ecdysteroid 22-kinase family protein [Frankia sp. Cpl3]OHV34926.1 aminoglycoside phosphotransferase [Parafrankia colletiae]